MLDYYYVFMCVVLDLIHDSSYLTILVYNGYIDDVIVMYDDINMIRVIPKCFKE